MASPCKRSILSCARCRRRKIKCGRQLPACAQCVTADASCTGSADKGKTADVAALGPGATVPRSLVQHLEAEIARLETALLQQGQLEVVQAADIFLSLSGAAAADAARRKTPPPPPLPPRPSLPSTSTVSAASTNTADPAGTGLRTAIIGGRCLQSVISATLPHEQGTAADLLSRVRMGLTPSSAKVRDGRNSSVVSTRVTGSTKPSQPLQTTLLRSMPWDIVQRLMRKYLHTVLPDNPFLVAGTVTEQFGRVAAVLAEMPPAGIPPATLAASTGIAPNHDFLVVYLVLAISVTLGSANNGHEARCAALSMSLFEEGIQHLYGLAVFPSDLAWLQTILLVLLYATVVPRAANVWVLSGVAMRSCLELGLHRAAGTEVEDDEDDDNTQLRRRVFWSAYCMDRSICAALQRPLSTPDAAIDVRLPQMPPAGAADDDEESPFLGSVTYYRLLSEMLHVHFLREPLRPPEATWDDWLAGMEQRLRAWHAGQRHGGEATEAAAAAEAASESMGFTAAAAAVAGPEPMPWTVLRQQSQHPDFSLARALMVLHRPSPRVPVPPEASLLRAFEAATAAERLHQWHLRRGFFRRPWLSAHYTLEAATIVLFCLRHGYAAIAARYTPADLFDRAKLLTANLLGIAAHGWPEVAVFAGTYERLLGPLLERVFRGGSGSDGGDTDLDTARFGPTQDAELMRLLYPGPAHLDRLRFGLRPPPEAFGPFDFTFFLMDDDGQMPDLGLDRDGVGMRDMMFV